MAATFRRGHECQRQAPACWPATLLHVGVPRVRTRPRRHRPRRFLRQDVDLIYRVPPNPRGPPMSIAPFPSSSPPRPAAGAGAAATPRAAARPRRRCCRSSAASCACRCVGGGETRYANLDYGATAPALASVAERVTRVLPYYGSVHRGSGLPARVSTALYEQARQAVAGFVGAAADHEVIFTRNTTDALNLLAAVVPADAGQVVFLDSEHHANLLPWRRREHTAVAVAPTLTETLVAAARRARRAADGAARDHRRLERHRRAAAAAGAGRAGARRRRADRDRRRPAGAARARRPRRARRRLPRALRPQALRALRRRRARRPPRLARRGASRGSPAAARRAR